MYRAKVAVPAPAVKSASVGHAARVALRARVVLDCVGQRMWCVVCDCGMACEVFGVSVRVYTWCVTMRHSGKFSKIRRTHMAGKRASERALRGNGQDTVHLVRDGDTCCRVRAWCARRPTHQRVASRATPTHEEGEKRASPKQSAANS